MAGGGGGGSAARRWLGMAAHMQPAALLPLLLATSAAARGRGASAAHRQPLPERRLRAPLSCSASAAEPPSSRAPPGSTPPAAEDDGRHRAAVDSDTPAPTRRQRPVRVRCSPPRTRLPPPASDRPCAACLTPTHRAGAEQRQARMIGCAGGHGDHLGDAERQPHLLLRHAAFAFNTCGTTCASPTSDPGSIPLRRLTQPSRRLCGDRSACR